MAFFQWRRFNFFDVVKDVDEGSLRKALQLVQTRGDDNGSVADITCFSSGKGYIAVGDDHGRVHLINRRFTAHTVKMFDRSTDQMYQVRHTGLVICIGRDAASAAGPGQPFLKVYDLDQRSDPDEPGTIVRNSRLMVPPADIAADGTSVATSLAVDDSLTLMAVGFSSGCVLLMRGDVTRERGVKQKVLLDGVGPAAGGSVTGLAFRTGTNFSWLYVVLRKKTLIFNVLSKDRETFSQLDNIGSEKGLAIRVENLPDVHLITARNDAVYFYNQDGRGQCYAIEGMKSALCWFRDYLVVSTAGRSDGGGDDGGGGEKYSLTVFDVQNKFIACSVVLKDPVRALMSEWGTLFVVVGTPEVEGGAFKIYQMTEKTLQAKLEMLFKKSFYDVAIKIAKQHKFDSYSLTDIFRQYGDHLYAKGDFAAAIENYIKTLGHLEPSYVIRRYVDAHRIQDLTAYLRALHAKGLANEDHTILLLNCYTKLRDTERLDDFIFKKDDKEALDFDVNVAIRVLRRTGYSSHALTLAEKHKLHNLYLKIQLDDLKKYQDALDYIADLELPEAEKCIKAHCGTLLENIPTETVGFLKMMCTDYRRRSEPLVREGDLSDSDEEENGHGERDTGSEGKPRGERVRSDPSKHLYHFVNYLSLGIEFLEFIIENNIRTSGPPDQSINTELIQHYLLCYEPDTENGARSVSLFIPDDYYLKPVAVREKERKERNKVLEVKIMTALRRWEELPYNVMKALQYCKLKKFKEGIMYLFERLELFSEVIRCHVKDSNIAAAVDVCRRFGDRNPNLWLQTLQFIVNVECGADVNNDHLTEVLTVIEQNRLMSPILVIRTLAESQVTLSMVKPYIRNAIKREQKNISENCIAIEKYKEEFASIEEAIENLTGKCQVYQATKCDACNHDLEVPAVYFYCQHAYHHQCLQLHADRDDRCPACMPENKRVMDAMKAQETSRKQQDVFFAMLEKADDAFAVVSDYIGRGVFDGISNQPEAVAPVQPPQPQLQPQAQVLPRSPPQSADPRGAVRSEAELASSYAKKSSVSSVGEQMKGLSISKPEASPTNQRMARSVDDRPQEHPKPEVPVVVAPVAPETASPTNPFGSDGESEGDCEHKQPRPAKLSTARSKDSVDANPFGEAEEDEEYDDSLNPFAS